MKIYTVRYQWNDMPRWTFYAFFDSHTIRGALDKCEHRHGKKNITIIGVSE